MQQTATVQQLLLMKDMKYKKYPAAMCGGRVLHLTAYKIKDAAHPVPVYAALAYNRNVSERQYSKSTRW